MADHVKETTNKEEEEMDASAKGRIDRFLGKHREELQEALSLSKNADSKFESLYDQLERVDRAIQARKENIAEVQKVIKENAINTSNISEDSGVSRKTFYNNPLLQKYVKENNGREDDDDSSAEMIEEMKRLRSTLKETQRKLDKVLGDTADSEDMKIQYKQLQAEIQRVQELYNSQGEKLEEVLKENSELKRKLSHILPFDGEESNKNKK